MPPVEKLYQNFCERMAIFVRLRRRSTRNMRICAILIVNSSVLCEPSVMNGASNSSELRALIRAENRNPAKRSPKLDHSAFAELVE